jgi:YidC/Oxa1 family membrane protein insertase
MSQEKRLILAVVLSIAVYVGFYKFITPPQPIIKKQVAAKVVTNQTLATTTQQAIQPVSKTPTLNTHELKAEVKTIAIDTGAANILLSTQGGVFTSYELKDYFKTADEDAPHKDLLTETEGSQAMFLGVNGYTAFNAKKVFKVSRDEQKNGHREITLTWYDDYIQIDKTFIFDAKASSYAVDVAYQVTNRSKAPLNLAPYLENSWQQKPEPKDEGMLSILKKFSPQDMYTLMYLQDDDSFETNAKWDGFTVERVSGAVKWSALGDRYFINAIIPNTTQNAEVLFQRQGNFLKNQYSFTGTTVPMGGTIQGGYSVYLGPKLVSELKLMNVSLDKAVDYGWFGVVATPILWFMSFLHSLIPSWGFVIIALTFIIKLLLHPINKKSMMSMKGMQQLQPKLKELKAKYPDDKQKQQQEMMQLFRTHKVNPMGGCLPMVLQMPIYFALYKVLWNAIELYHVPFLFYKDLSAPDPYYIAPILLGVFMFLQQKLTPSPTTDSSQKTMMMIMPVMFTVFMLFLPVGLVVYIFVNTVVSVIQQYMIKRDISLRDVIRGKWQPKDA